MYINYCCERENFLHRRNNAFYGLECCDPSARTKFSLIHTVKVAGNLLNSAPFLHLCRYSGNCIAMPAYWSHRPCGAARDPGVLDEKE